MRFFRLWKYLSELHKTEYTKSFCVFSSYFRTIKDNWIKVFTDSEHSEHLKSLLIKIRIDVSNYNNIDEIKKSFQSIIESSNANDWRINFLGNRDLLFIIVLDKLQWIEIAITRYTYLQKT